jgi:hypothetical protein
MIACILLVVHLLSYTIVLAHTAAEENDVHVVLHIDPGDSPIVNTPATLHFYSMGIENHLNEIRECRLRILATSTSQILSEYIFPHAQIVQDSTKLSATFTFPSLGMYPVILTCVGTTEADRIFTFNVSVTRTNSAMSISELTNNWTHYFFHHSLHFFIFGGGFLVGIILTLRSRKIKTKT